jgi:hypothetical protein
MNVGDLEQSCYIFEEHQTVDRRFDGPIGQPRNDRFAGNVIYFSSATLQFEEKHSPTLYLDIPIQINSTDK